MKIKKFSQLNEEYGPETLTVGELKEKLTKSDPDNFVYLKIKTDSGVIQAIVVGTSFQRVDKNRYELIIQGTKVG